MTELHHKSPNPSEPRLSSSLSKTPAAAEQQKKLSPLPSQQSFQTISSMNNMSIEQDAEADDELELVPE